VPVFVNFCHGFSGGLLFDAVELTREDVVRVPG
jgi:hypothetical protein